MIEAGAAPTPALASFLLRAARRLTAFGPPVVVWLPACVVAALAALPLAYLLLRTAGAGPGVGEFLARPRTLEVLFNSVSLAAAVTAATVAISLPLAWLTVRTDLPWRRAWTVLLSLPLVIPTYVGGFVLVAALGPRGMLQGFLEPLTGVQRLPEIYGLFGATLALTLFSYPYVLLTVRAGLQGMDPALEEASRSLGRGAWATFREITLPQLRPSIAAGGLLVALYTLSDFGAVSLLQFDTFTRAIYLQYQASFDRTVAAQLALLLVALATVILYGEHRARGRAQCLANDARAARPPTTLRLGRWRWPAFALCVAVFVAALGVPLAVLLYWLGRGMAHGARVDLVLGAAVNSAYVSALAAGAATLGAIPVAVLAVRFRGRLSALVEGGIYVGYALPGIVVALALVFFGANFLPGIYQTVGLLVLAYTVRFLPQAVGATRSSLLQVNRSLEEAAAGLGRPPWQVLATVTVPLLRPGVLTGLGLVFLTTMKELPATLLLSPIGFKTLATAIWSAAAEGFFAVAAAPSLLLVLVSGLSMLLIFRGESTPHRRGGSTHG